MWLLLPHWRRPALRLERRGDGGAEGVSGDEEFVDGRAAEDVLLQNALEALGRDVGVPGAVGVDNEDGALLADAKAAGLGPHHFEAELLDATLNVVPSLLALAHLAAVGAEAEEEM